MWCSLGDKNYLEKGIAMVRSVKEPVTYLCLDDITHKVMSREPGVTACLLSDFEERYGDLREAKASRPYREYCWTLASWWCRHLLRHHDWVGYIDADIQFHQYPQLVLDDLGDNDVGIISHRHNLLGCIDGAYNVGVVLFRSGGSDCLNWWAESVLGQKYSHLATCGDQKYLEEFSKRFPKVKVLEACAHGAPWNFRLYVWDDLTKTGEVVWGRERQPYVFTHFSRMSCDFSTDVVSPASGQYEGHTLNGQVFEIPEVKMLYQSYYDTLRGIHNEILRS